MRRSTGFILAGIVCALVVTCATTLSLYRAAKTVPDFYRQALATEQVTSNAAGDELEQQVVNLHNDLQSGENWEAVFTADQINGWLATDLEEKFPGLLPSEVHQPRVAIQDGKAHVACRVETKKLTSVMSFSLEGQLTDQPNEIAIRIVKARAGVLPLPLKKVLDRITQRAKSAKVPLRWAQVDGQPIALVRLPENRSDLRPGVKIEQLQLRTGELYLAGTSDRTDESDGSLSDRQRVAESAGVNINTQR